VNLARGLLLRGHRVSIVVMKPGGVLECECSQIGIPIIHLQRGARLRILACLVKFVKILRAERPDIIHSYLPVANVLGTASVVLANVGSLVWGVRSSFVDFAHYSPLVKWADFFQRILHPWCRKIIANSEAGRSHLISQGLPGGKVISIPNGIDTQRFVIDRQAGAKHRINWGIAPQEILIGLVARLDPMKDHETFLAAVLLLECCQDCVRFVCVGGGGEGRMAELLEVQHRLGLDGRIHWSGDQADMPSVMNALDMLCLSSKGEGFPNVLGEALACGVPCVSTDVGDATLIISDQSVTVPTGDPQRLAQAMAVMIKRIRAGGVERLQLRSRIVERFSIEALVERTEQTLKSLCNDTSSRRSKTWEDKI
jgi:glycosyltransferase involved in cell wall biosynthesis